MKYLRNLADWRGKKRAGGMARQQKRTLKWCFIGLAEWLPIRDQGSAPGVSAGWERERAEVRRGERSRCPLLRPRSAFLPVTVMPSLGDSHLQLPPHGFGEKTYVYVILEAISFPTLGAPLTWESCLACMSPFFLPLKDSPIFFSWLFWMDRVMLSGFSPCFVYSKEYISVDLRIVA